MTINSSGTLSMGGSTSGQSIELELYNGGQGYNSSGTASISMNDSAVRTLLGVSSGAISMSSAYGKSSYTPTVHIFTSSGTFTYVAGMGSISYITVGGGGGGHGGISNAAGSGGTGGYTVTGTATISSSFTVTIGASGAGGSGGIGSGGTGATGGTTQFSGGLTQVAPGGAGASGYSSAGLNGGNYGTTSNFLGTTYGPYGAAGAVGPSQPNTAANGTNPGDAGQGGGHGIAQYSISGSPGGNGAAGIAVIYG